MHMNMSWKLKKSDKELVGEKTEVVEVNVCHFKIE